MQPHTNERKIVLLYHYFQIMALFCGVCMNKKYVFEQDAP